MPLTPGIVSVTFRGLGVDALAAEASACGLRSVEWGADVHVPVGSWPSVDAALATGLDVAAYGSYYWAGHDEPSSFDAVVATAARLGAPTIRIWAGRVGSAEADASARAAVADSVRAAAARAADAGMTVSLEYHANTLTDTAESALALLDAVDHSAALTYWQPPNGVDDDDALAGLRAVSASGKLTHVHVFSWWPMHERLPLTGRESLWREALAVVASLPGEHHAMLEFVADDDPTALAADASTLHRLIEEASA